MLLGVVCALVLSVVGGIDSALQTVINQSVTHSLTQSINQSINQLTSRPRYVGYRPIHQEDVPVWKYGHQQNMVKSRDVLEL